MEGSILNEFGILVWVVSDEMYDMIEDTYQATIKSMVDVLILVSSCLGYGSTLLYLEHDAIGIWRCDISA